MLDATAAWSRLRFLPAWPLDPSSPANIHTRAATITATTTASGIAMRHEART
ncbi:MAG: hypothetical protein R2711_17600 [Acidimicrobiales bacterium]